MITEQGPYRPLRNMSLANAYPVLQGYKNWAGIGYRFNFEDPLSFAKLGITAAYTPTTNLPASERGHIDIFGSYLGWRVAGSWNRSDFYDLFGPTKRSRKGYAAKLGYDWLLIYDDPQKLEAVFDFAYYDQIDTLPNAQNIDTNFTRLVTGEAGLRYTDLRRSLGAVDDEKGIAWSLIYTGNRVNGEITPQGRATLDYGIALPFAHTSLWLHTAGGIADGIAQHDGRELLLRRLRQQLRRRRPDQALPGVLLAARLRAERDKRAQFREGTGRAGPAARGLRIGRHGRISTSTWLRPSVFVAGLWTELGNATKRKDYASLGAQADLRFTILHWYDMTLSGWLRGGLPGAQRAGTEWMISLKIM